MDYMLDIEIIQRIISKLSGACSWGGTCGRNHVGTL
jgi:hypothetical protein